MKSSSNGAFLTECYLMVRGFSISRSKLLTVATGIFVTYLLIQFLTHNSVSKTRRSNITSIENGRLLPENDTIHIALLVGGLKACQQLYVMLKSLRFHLGDWNADPDLNCALPVHQQPKKNHSFDTRSSLVVHLIVDAVAHNHLADQLDGWHRQSGIRFFFYPLEPLMDQVKSIKSGHYSGSRSYIKLLIPQLLASRTSKVILMDTDILLNAPIKDLWDKFSHFNHHQCIGMVKEQNAHYWFNVGILHWPDVELGYNAGLILLDLRKLLAMHSWNELWLSALDYLQHKLGVLPSGEQDILNRIIQMKPGIAYTLPCTWNVQLSVSARTEFCPILRSQLRGDKALDYGVVPDIHLFHINAHVKPEDRYPRMYIFMSYLEDKNYIDKPWARHQLVDVYYRMYFSFRELPENCLH